MRALNRAYSPLNQLDTKNLYLFMFAGGDTENKLQGDMPLKSQFGYIFNVKESTTASTARTIAHELGHGFFELRHTFSKKYNVKQGTTDNLMDYNNGEELVKYQWDVLRDPKKRLFDWAQNEGEGQIVFGENSLGNIVRAVQNIRCAKERNAKYTNLYFSNSSYSVEIKDLVSAFKWAGSDVFNEKIRFYISNEGEINLDYFEDEFNVQDIRYNYNKYQVVLKGKERTIFIKPYNKYSDYKKEIYSFIKSLFDESISINMATKADDINGMKIEELRYLSICQLELMNDYNRKKILKSISEQNSILAKDEKLVINLLKTTHNPPNIYSLLQNGKISIDLYKGMNTYKQEFVFLFNWICEASWSSDEKQKAKLLFLGTDNKGNHFKLSENDWMMGDCLDESEIRIWNIENNGGKYSHKFTSTPSAPIRIAYLGGKTKIVSTIMVDYMRNIENKEEWTKAFFDYLTGVGLSSAGRLFIVKSTPNIIKFLAITEFGKTNIDFALKDEG